MKASEHSQRFGFSVAALLVLLAAVLVIDYGVEHLEYTHGAVFYIAVGVILLAVASICAWLAWASSGKLRVGSRIVTSRLRP